MTAPSDLRVWLEELGDWRMRNDFIDQDVVDTLYRNLPALRAAVEVAEAVEWIDGNECSHCGGHHVPAVACQRSYEPTVSLPTREDWEWFANAWTPVGTAQGRLGNFARQMAAGKLVAVPPEDNNWIPCAMHHEVKADRDRLARELEEARGGALEARQLLVDAARILRRTGPKP